MRSVRQFIRDWRSREIRLLVSALIIAVMAVTSVGFFTDRIDRAMRAQATTFFGADLIIQSTRPMSEQYANQARSLGLETAMTTEFPSVVVAGNESALVQIRAVSFPYPLLGNLETSPSLEQPGAATNEPIADGEIWAEANVLHRLNIGVGDKVQVGEKHFTVGRVITFAADSGGNPFQLAPKVFLPMGQLAGTGLLSPASRATFRFLAAGDAGGVATLQKQLEDELTASETLQTAGEGSSEINTALDRASRFMGLATILTVILAGAAVALASASYTRREAAHIAVMKSIGFTRQQLRNRYLLSLAAIIIVTTLFGSLLGYVSHILLTQILSSWMPAELPAASFRPLASGLITAWLTLVGFTLPALSKLLSTPPARILRNEGEETGVSVPLMLISSGAATWVFLIWQAQDLKLASLVFIAVLLSIAILFYIAQLVARFSKLMPLKHAASWRLAIRNAGRYQQRSALLITTFGISVLALMMLSAVREDLMQAWQASIPQDAPNHFLINIQPQELTSVDEFLKQRGNDQYQLYPMIRGRLVAVNDHPVSGSDYDDPRASRLVNREFNLSASSTLPEGNIVIAGDWGQSLSAGELSLESGIADTLGFELGDQLTFDIAGQRFSQNIGNLREVNWDTMQPNFFVIIPPELAASYPATYITSLFVSEDDQRFTAELVKSFPAITVLDVRTILEQVRLIIEQASKAVQYVFGFTILAGIIVLLAALQTQRHERSQEIAVLKTLGGRQSQIKWSVATEFAYIGAISGLVGSVLALGLGWMLATQIFDLNYSASLLPSVLSILLSSLFVGITGILGVRPLLPTKPIALLRGE